MEIANRGDAPGDVALSGPAFDVRMRIDETGNDGLADKVHPHGVLRNLDLVHTRDGFDVTIADDDDGVLFGRSTRAVNERHALERDDVVFGE